MKTIVLVGGGPAAISICSALSALVREAHLLTEKIKVVVFEKSDTIGPGLPYSPEEDCYILNLPIQAMRADFSDQNGFSNWMRDNHENITSKSQFPARKYFGYYLMFLAKKLENTKQISGKLEIEYHTNTEVVGINKNTDQDGKKYKINTKKKDVSQQTAADLIVFCTGHMPNNNYEFLKLNKRYRHNQWTEDAFDEIKSNEDVGIIGSRLSAIDILMKLINQGHKGNIYMFSRSGLLPAVLPEEMPPYTLKHITLQNLEKLTKSQTFALQLSDFLELFWKEIREASENKSINFNSIIKSSDKISALEWIEKEIKEAETEVRPWQKVLFAMYPIVPFIWRNLSYDDKKIFLQKYYNTYITYLAAFPLKNAHKVKTALQEKQLQVIGNLIGIEFKEEESKFFVRTGTKTCQCDILFNATGPGYDPSKITLYHQMISNKIAIKNKLGGLHVDPITLQLRNAEGEIEPDLYALGELTRGDCLATTDMAQLSTQADRVANEIMRSLQTKGKVNCAVASVPNKAKLNFDAGIFGSNSFKLACAAIVCACVAGSKYLLNRK